MIKSYVYKPATSRLILRSDMQERVCSYRLCMVPNMTILVILPEIRKLLWMAHGDSFSATSRRNATIAEVPKSLKSYGNPKPLMIVHLYSSWAVVCEPFEEIHSIWQRISVLTTHYTRVEAHRIFSDSSSFWVQTSVVSWKQIEYLRRVEYDFSAYLQILEHWSS